MSEQEQVQKNASTTVADNQNASDYLETRAFAPIPKSHTGSSEQPTPPRIQKKSSIGHSFANLMIQAPAASIIQPKLTIGEPGDKYEQEADSVAAQVVQKINSPAVSSKNEKSVQRQQASEEEELQMKPMADVIQRMETSEEEELQMKSAGDSGRNASANLETSINQARGGGQSLNDSIRQPMEQAFGADFSGVKVHTDGKSDQLNQSIQAKAFTTGQDIFFRQGEYNPGSKGGQELLAHELTHVVQQSGGAVNRLQCQDLEQQEEKKEDYLTPEEEQEWLQAKPQIQRKAETTIQRAWTGRRQLSNMGWLGKPWVWRKKGNLLNWGGYHEHIFFEDGGNPANIGHMGKKGLGQDAGHGENEYTRVRENLNDQSMRAAVQQVNVQPGSYSLLSNNCQKYVQQVLKVYERLDN